MDIVRAERIGYPLMADEFEAKRQRQRQLLPFVVVGSHALVLLGLAAFSLSPVIIRFSVIFREHQGRSSEPWIYPLILIAVLQIFYAIYLIQVRDGSAIQVLTFVLLGITLIYAVIGGISCALLLERSLSPHGVDLVLSRMGIANEMNNGRAALWSGAMIGVYGLAAHYFKRSASRWRS